MQTSFRFGGMNMFKAVEEVSKLKKVFKLYHTLLNNTVIVVLVVYKSEKTEETAATDKCYI